MDTEIMNSLIRLEMRVRYPMNCDIRECCLV